ncbi:MAG: putative conserved prophage protein [Mycoplasmataceae bacterium RV_VA103A]|nr:MAG: putative conserved prophage protein [Mycoplasmataceae bacterium RV_VA103A]
MKKALINKEEKTTEAKRREAQRILASINRLASIMEERKKFTCSKCGQDKKIILAALDKSWREICLCWDCGTPKVLESFLGKEGLEKIIKRWESKLKKLELNPLSIAKYFYEKWKVSDPVIMQRLIYFAYLETLKKENIILFEEKFQAWPGGPVLESVIYPMYENCENLENFFAKIEKIEELNITVPSYLKTTAKKYLNLNSSQTHREACNKLWSDALNEESDVNPIDENRLFVFVQKSRRQPISLTTY